MIAGVLKALGIAGLGVGLALASGLATFNDVKSNVVQVWKILH